MILHTLLSESPKTTINIEINLRSETFVFKGYKSWKMY